MIKNKELIEKLFELIKIQTNFLIQISRDLEELEKLHYGK